MAKRNNAEFNYSVSVLEFLWREMVKQLKSFISNNSNLPKRENSNEQFSRTFIFNLFYFLLNLIKNELKKMFLWFTQMFAFTWLHSRFNSSFIINLSSSCCSIWREISSCSHLLYMIFLVYHLKVANDSINDKKKQQESKTTIY